ncbi:hypothetical protein HKX48_003130 [Thoreauomyces humboldtii]|nr:hypothetical protein HKX48_003130 [Thoreauomyces humboldtii]
MFVIRGENVVLLGEIDKEKEAAAASTLQQIPVDAAREAQKAEAERRKAREKIQKRILHDRGFSVDVLEQHDQY